MARARPLAETLSPSRLLAGGLDWTGRTSRAGFAAMAGVMGGLWALRAFGPANLDGWSRGWEALAVVPLALMLVPGMGQTFRRLNDAGLRGAWAWLLLVPWARWGLVVVLALTPASQRRRRIDGGWRAFGMGLAGLAGLVLLGSTVWATAPVTASGMKPALLPGDLAILRRGPLAARRGDVVAFRLAEADRPLVGRVIALPGETVAVEGGRPVIDGAQATQGQDGWWTEAFGREGPLGAMPTCGNGAVGLGAACTTRRLTETLPGGASYAVLDAGPRPLDAMAALTVPEGALFVMGDDRDAAEDSRRARGAQGTGLIPEAAVLGRVTRVLASSSAVHAWDPRGWRLGRILEPVR